MTLGIDLFFILFFLIFFEMSTLEKDITCEPVRDLEI